jgi:D-alanyl-D-alanine carboxypeptidase
MPALANAATLARLAAVAAVLALVGLLGVRPAVDSDGLGARAMGLLPACRYDDILTSPRGYDDWETTLVDTILRVPKSYAPPDLVKVATLGVPGKGQVRAVMADDLTAMSDAAAAAGNPIGVHSAYRSYATQVAVFDHWVDVHGYDRALELSARPGHSEHQLGLGVDFRSDPAVDTLQGSWGATPAGKWMRNHAWEYGFVMSYPKGKMSLVCYDYEPWHFRYVGRELAAQIRASGLTLRQYLWANFTTTVVPKVTPKPTTKATPKPAATKTPPPSVAPSPSTEPSAASTAVPATIAPPVTPKPATVAPPSAAPTAPQPVTTPDPGPPAAPGSFDPSTVASVAIGGAALALGTIVLGGILLLRRRGRSGVGL